MGFIVDPGPARQLRQFFSSLASAVGTTDPLPPSISARSINWSPTPTSGPVTWKAGPLRSWSASFYEERSRKRIGDFALSDRINGCWDLDRHGDRPGGAERRRPGHPAGLLQALGSGIGPRPTGLLAAMSSASCTPDYADWRVELVPFFRP
jgi:hypothetical protein